MLPDATSATKLAPPGLIGAQRAGANALSQSSITGMVTHVLRVVIADDDPVMRMLLSAVISSDPDLELVGQAEDADGAIALALSETPDVALLDVEMPGGGGLRAAREIKSSMPGVRVLALSAHDTDEARSAMSEAGADGYVVKGAPPAEMAAALRGGASLF
jgi:DNA-binding NarL/FixJ family response regulator